MNAANRALARALPLVPEAIVRRVAARYIAGESVADAVRVVGSLAAEGKLATLDVLGEEVRSAAEADAMTRSYLDLLDVIVAEGLPANVSVKPTALGLELGRDLLRAKLEQVVAAAGERGLFVRVDMEDSSTTDATLATYRELRGAGYENVGIVLQSALRRTVQDARELAGLRPSVRVCKGIYVEPESIAFRDAEQIRASFVETVATLLEAGASVALATHDDRLLRRCLALIRERRLSPEEYELQVLLGVRPALAARLAGAGHRVRVYVPFGPRWYEYSLRRLRENPRVATQIGLALLRRPRGR